MKLPLSLLKSFLIADLSIQKIAETLTLLGIEVDHIFHEKPPFAKVVAADVTACAPHPNADRLQVAQVSDGQKTYQVVCGGTNCRAGIRVPFALPGAVLTGEDGKIFRIEETKLRGVLSSGMICSAEELHLSGGAPGTIMELPSDIEVGKDLVPLLWDPVLELSLTPNLGHCFSALGIARELSAALQIPLHHPHLSVSHGKTKVQEKIDVSVEADLCKRYMGRWCDGVHIGPSPLWLQQLLLAAGMKPISNAVDLANYMLLKWGQPMHVFDGEKIEGNKIRVITTAAAGKFLGLDQVEREVPKGTLVIADGSQPLALAGIIGGAGSAVSNSTTQIFLECAVFDPLTIRKTARAISLRTESAQRFERGVDPVGCAAALEEACYWLTELTGGTLASGAIDLKQGSFAPKKVPYRTERINSLLGLKLSQSEIEGIFHRLGFKTNSNEAEIPLFRSDISEEIDLVEEVARIYGYNHIPKNATRCTTSQLPHDPIYLFEKSVRTGCIQLGLQEFLNADLIGPALAHLFATPLLKTLHSKSEEYSLLRASLLPGLLQSAKHNFDHKTFSFGAFEIGRIHLAQEELTMVALLLTGNSSPSHWSGGGSRPYDFYDLKGALENLLTHLNLPTPSFSASDHILFHPGRQAHLSCGKVPLGFLGEVHPALLEKFDIKQPVLFAELHLETALSFQRKSPRMTPLSQFPASERDWTVSLPLDAEIASLFQKMHSFHTPLLAKVELIDLYYPEEAKQKNATFRFTYRDPLKTVSFEEVETAHHNLLAEIAK